MRSRARRWPDRCKRVLAGRGIEQLYVHQVAALEAARAGRDLVVVTGTASGKTLCYNLPILEAVLQAARPVRRRLLYLFPTKALAQDQLKGLLELVGGDAEPRRGDSAGRVRRRHAHRPAAPDSRRGQSRALESRHAARVACCRTIRSGPRSSSELRYVVLDEVHTYRGILGAHVSAVLRRLMRVCEHYGSQPVFLAASATIANPGELVSRLIGREVEVIDDDGSPRGRKYFALWNPAPLGNDSLARRSANDDAVTWLDEAIEAGGQALAFTPHAAGGRVDPPLRRESRSSRQQSPHADKVRAYRGGYLPNERREIEQDLFAGQLRGVAATNALELGIDIGSLDVALLVNYPGTIASSWQQAGRSGRRHDESLAVLLAGNDPVDQYLLRHPEYFFAQSPEHAVVDPDNPYVLAKHLQAAAFELPLDGRRPRPRSARWPRRSPRRSARRGQLVEVKRRLLLPRRAEPGRRRQPAAHERQHVQHRADGRADSRRRTSGQATRSDRSTR